MSIAEAARAWQQAGVSVIPILANGTKEPALRWTPYRVQAPSLDQVDTWWGNGREYGLALVCGAVSGQLEMLELEGRVFHDHSYPDLERSLPPDTREVWDYLSGPDGYLEISPSGGLHLLYRISDHAVPQNTKIARRQALPEELTEQERSLLAADPDKIFLRVLAETRGEGGYVITAPTSGLCHPSGEPWQLVVGEYGRLPTVTWAQREALHATLRELLDSTPPEVATVTRISPDNLIFPRDPGSPLSPGDDFEARTDWSTILEPHGWILKSTSSHECYWTRPGKDPRDGISATTGRDPGRDRLYVFSTSTVFESERSYTKFGAFALLNFGGDHAAAARELVRLGFGERRDPAEGIIPPDRSRPPPSTPSPRAYSLDEVGNAQRLWDKVKGRYHYIAEEKRVLRWDGVAWVEDFDGALTREAITCTEDMAREAAASNNDTLARWARTSRSRAKLNATCELMRSMPGATRRVSDLDPHRHLLNLPNGVLDLRTSKLVDHDPTYLMTRVFGAAYDPDAKCPEFEAFMATVLPDEEMRRYVQRALGYTLLGDVDQRAMFLVHGPSSTGKSTLMETIRAVFGDYGATAAAGAFRARGRDSAPTNDLHDLRGKRFVTTSETTEHATYDEDTLKRLTGRDRVRTRELYQSNQEWTPQCVLWVATNHPPKFSSDDDAVWRRAKLVPFLTQFDEDTEIADLARTALVPEAAGILSWLLAGLTAYRTQGLDEPEQVRQAAREQRRMADPVARFLDERLAEGVLILAEGASIKVSELHLMYGEWSRVNGERVLGIRRFGHRIASLYPVWEMTRLVGQLVWRGVGRSAAASLLGTMMTTTYLPDP